MCISQQRNPVISQIIDLRGSQLRLFVTDDIQPIGCHIFTFELPVYSSLTELFHAVHLEYILFMINRKRCNHYHRRFFQGREFRYTDALRLQWRL